MTTKVAIVGAGVCGLTAARELKRHGVEVIVFDKGRSPGGRVSTRRAPPWHFDHGAQYFTARSEAFRAQLDDWLERGVAAEWKGRICVARDGRLEPKTDGPRRYVGIPSMSALARDLATDVEVETGLEVTRVHRAEAGWSLETEAGPVGESRVALIITTPPEQAVGLLEGQTELTRVLAETELAPCWALMAAFEDGPLELEADGIFGHDSPIAWAANNGSKPGRTGHAWTIHASPEWSRANLERDAESVAPELLGAFFELVGRPARSPAHMAAHRWRYSIPVEAKNVGALVDESARLVCAGDWCAGARVEGAYSSGLAAAARVRGWLDSTR